MDWSLEAYGFVLILVLLPVVGTVFLYWGLWGDRSKGRARCPKCWYDMRGSLPRLECPECGHDAGEEQHLYADRVLRGPYTTGCLLLLLSCLLLVFGLLVLPLIVWLD